MALWNRKHPVSTTASSPGGPVYDAKIDPAYAAEFASVADALQAQTMTHLFDSKSAAARAYSHAYDQSPNPVAVAMMGLGQQQALLERHMTRQWQEPFVGAHLGPVPSFSRSPDTSPIIGGVGHLTHHAHIIESERATRRRFKS